MVKISWRNPNELNICLKYGLKDVKFQGLRKKSPHIKRIGIKQTENVSHFMNLVCKLLDFKPKGMTSSQEMLSNV